ncbi:pentatricopeptide repeat-containing protein At4g02750 [Selaginella moellendorffii]|uniref:pentatricopeptide repeat-containing protein At4g02750 n=1 Tax=Selaginella moellendorffii TaxID=88036 RepID=UPI000D1C9F00|nr:pentatricopeptide repeat-containing protein At4g02750 [Selaginella moellendorffii]|eukprot:XP_024528077.1 pentatricopeptide repeat-containing protein At4g02750 [Selaginella moellendorffii]
MGPTISDQAITLQQRSPTSLWLQQIQAAAKRLKSCRSLSECRLLRAEIERTHLARNRYLTNVLVETLGKFGQLEEVSQVFARIRQPNVFSWNIMVAAYAQNGRLEESRDMFEEKMAERDVVSWTTMVAAYAQSKQLEEAQGLFDRMPERNEVSWNTMISAYAQSGYLGEAEKLFRQMPAPDVVSRTLMVVAYAQAGHLLEARWAFESMPERDTVAWTAMLVVYAQAGDVAAAELLFHTMPDRNLVSWNAMLQARARGGALELAQRMNVEGVRPDEITFMSVLHACSHLGLVEESLRQFASMVVDHAETPRVEHRACVVDVLGRVGELDGAEDVVGSLPAPSGALAWTTLTGAAKMHGAVGHGVRAANAVFRMDPSDSAPYVLLQLHLCKK